MAELTSLIFYLFIFGIILLLFNCNRIGPLIGITLLILLSICRWDIGNDYLNYYWSSKIVASVLSNANFSDAFTPIRDTELSYQLIIYFFSNWDYPVIGTLGIYATINSILWYITLRRINGLFWGFFIIFFMGILFNSWDQVRQSVAISIFLYSTRYVSTNQIFRYTICCVFAFFFHLSAIILFPLYFLARIKYPNFFIIATLIVLIIGFLTGLWTKFFSALFSLLDFYSHYADDKTDLQTFNSGLGIMTKMAIYIFIAFAIRNKDIVISNIILFGVSIYLFGSANEMIQRISNYGTNAILIGFPIFMHIKYKEYKSRTKRLLAFIKYTIPTIILLLGIYNTYKGGSGCNPYSSIFSEQCYQRKFRPRNY